MKGLESVPYEDILALARGDLPPERAEKTRARIREDEAARALYDRCAEAAEALEPGALSDRVFERLSLELERPRTLRRSFFGWLGGLAAVATTAAMLAVMIPSADDGYHHRGGPALDGDHLLRVVRAEVGPEGQVTVTTASRVEAGDALRFAVASSAAPARVSLVVREDRSRTVLSSAHPLDPSLRPVRIPVAYTVPEGLSSLTVAAVFEHAGGPRDLIKLSLEPRDEPGLAVRVVELEVGAAP